MGRERLPGLHYDAARAYALASQAFDGRDQAKSQAFSEQAIHLLRTAIQDGYADYSHLKRDTDLDPIRKLPAFAEIMRLGHLDCPYTAVWTFDNLFEARPLFAVDSTSHLQRCRELASQGYRMVSLSVARTSPDGPLVTTSVWRRPKITEEARDRLAERQARAAIALLDMWEVEEVMPLLRHSADPRLRSFIINWFKP